MVCAPVRSIIPELKLRDYLYVQAHKPCSISHLFHENDVHNIYIAYKSEQDLITSIIKALKALEAWAS